MPKKYSVKKGDSNKKDAPKIVDGVYGYVRVSTRKQDLSFEAQKDTIEKYCSLHDMKIEKIFEDKSTGANTDRDGYQELCARIDDGKVKAIIVTKLDRLSRSLKDFLNFFEDRIKPNKIKFHSIKDNIDTTTAMGRFFMKIIMIFAEFERETNEERTISVLNFKRENGEYIGSLPLGFDKNPSGKKYCANIEELRIVKKIFEYKEAGLSYRAIAKVMESDHESGTKRGGKWYANTVRLILLNDIYKSVLEEYKDEIDGAEETKIVENDEDKSEGESDEQ